MQKRVWIWLLVVTLGAAMGFSLYWTHSSRIDWQAHVNPGELSRAHARLSENCESCHTPVQDVDRNKCVACHANNKALLQRQPTAFHASVTECVSCHQEHQGVEGDLRVMNHEQFARVALRELEMQGEKETVQATSLSGWLESGQLPHSAAYESALNCFSCHATVDKHQGLFGSDCQNCHETPQWAIARFRHPSPNSTDCFECHKAPPSHYMMHFEMVSKKVARQEDARVAACCGVAQVRQCYRCHQTTSWNDIIGVGWYKHH